jgi:hypothetical protein
MSAGSELERSKRQRVRSHLMIRVQTMMRTFLGAGSRSWWVAVVVCIGTLASGAQTSAKRVSGSMQDTVYNLEHRLAQAEKQHNKRFFESSLDDELVYVAYNGLVFTKNKLLTSMQYIDVNHYSMENFKTRALGAEAALVTYDLKINASIAGSQLPAKQYASSVWVRKGGSWELIFHQTTPAEHR